MRSQAELSAILQGLLSAWESEVVEFKEAGQSFKTSEIGHSTICSPGCNGKAEFRIVALAALLPGGVV